MSIRGSLYTLFRESAADYPDQSFLAVPGRLASEWDITPEITYRETLRRIDELAEVYAGKGFAEGDRVALAFESRPHYFFHYLALNSLGACAVPLNTDLTAVEIAYQLAHSDCAAAVTLPTVAPLVREAIALTGRAIALTVDNPGDLPPLRRTTDPRTYDDPLERPAAVLYTSGTTGNPKGCVLSNLYVQESGRYYADLDGDVAVSPGAERMLNPLPLYHMNSMVTTAGAAIHNGACLVLPGRFSAGNWWNDVVDTRATRFNYLGIMIPALLSLPETDTEKEHSVRFAFGAGVDPSAHRRFEQRFGISLMEVWGMTETGRFLIVDREPRHIDTRACGRALPGLEAKIVDNRGRDLPDGETGELVVRHTAAQPRSGFFSGYLKDPDATEKAWEGGWFHSGDLCTRSPDGMFYFVDRSKNIVRRSGENISSAEVEAVLSASPLVAQVAVLAVPDAMRDEEVLACVVLDPHISADRATAGSLAAHARSQLAYYKVPGWIYFVEELPTTGTQKIQKHRIFPDGFSADLPGLFDLRATKKRGSTSESAGIQARSSTTN
ncbi:AMP-binding protein [Rhodococcus sp. CSLK01-03]|uniref:AMP-binding protein n=1 Tax=Rhodococcus indonesiensis TaxID=3055869 RepID=A0ABT7RP25_9NOCA|nr:AMP-binding protein [Rhodococcus indonesiensis]MDM7489357.1 AMP-binding protein [Rhodococcus indonesiensis]